MLLLRCMVRCYRGIMPHCRGMIQHCRDMSVMIYIVLLRSRSAVAPLPQLFFNEIAGFETSSRPYLVEV